METTARPPITPPATATVVWVLVAPPGTFCALFVKPAPAFADSMISIPVVAVVTIVSTAVVVLPVATSEVDVPEDTSDVIAGAKMSLVGEVETKPRLVV